MARALSPADESALAAQRDRPLAAATAARLDAERRKHWDLFYKRNGARFFRDRHWTAREFEQLARPEGVLLEIGCGVGNLVVPLLEERAPCRVIACDVSAEAIRLLRSHPLYDERRVTAVVADATTDQLFSSIERGSADIATLVFVLSAISPRRFGACVRTAFDALKPGGALLFRDYARHDAAQLRFKPGRLIADNFYARQDGTTTYFFELDELRELLRTANFEAISCEYVERRTVNRKENIDVARYFIQANATKPNV